MESFPDPFDLLASMLISVAVAGLAFASCISSLTSASCSSCFLLWSQPERKLIGYVTLLENAFHWRLARQIGVIPPLKS